MIKLICEESFVPDLNKSIHYISWTPFTTTGYSGLMWVSGIVRMFAPEVDAQALFGAVDSNSETGILYPKANITIMPSYNQPYSDEDIYRHFNDAMKAQKQFIKAEYIIFDMRNYSYSNPHTGSCDNGRCLKMIESIARSNLFIEKGRDEAEKKVYVIVNQEDASLDYYCVSSDELNKLRAEK